MPPLNLHQTTPEPDSVPCPQQLACCSADASQAATVRFPIEALPLDVLTEVFYRAAQSPFLHDSQDPKSSPSNIAAVCRLWRDIALSTRTLWSNFTLHQLFEPKPNIRLEKARAYLQRSKDAPLHVSVHVGEPVPILRELLVLIDQNRRRCVTVHIWLAKRYPVPRGFMNVADMPYIEELKLYMPYWRRELDLSKNPRIALLHHTHEQRFNLHLGETPLRSLTTVRLGTLRYQRRGGFPLAACMALLRAAPELEALSMTIYETQEGDGRVKGSHPMVHLTKLRELELFHETQANVGDLRFVLQHLVAPNLAKVDIGVPDRLTTNDDCGITDCLKRTHPNNSLWYFSPNTLLVSELKRCLPFVPSLESLDLTLRPERLAEQPEVTALLTLKAGSTVQICPKLNVLDIRTHGNHGSSEQIITVILSRWNPPEGPRYFRKAIIWGLPQSFIEDPRIVQCVEEGLIVETEHY